MKRWERWTFNLSSFVVAVTGFIYLWMKYALESDDPFSILNHPWQSSILGFHVLASPAFILMFGIVLNSHIMKKLRADRSPNRKSGLVALATFVVMVVSGYLLQVTSSETWLRALIVLHIASGAVFSLAYFLHLVISSRIARASRSVAIREVA